MIKLPFPSKSGLFRKSVPLKEQADLYHVYVSHLGALVYMYPTSINSVGTSLQVVLCWFCVWYDVHMLISVWTHVPWCVLSLNSHASVVCRAENSGSKVESLETNACAPYHLLHRRGVSN